MNKLPPDDQQLPEFLRQYRPIPPEATPDLEDQLMSKIVTARKPARKRQMWAVPSMIVAGLLMVFGGYYTLILASDSANLEAFLESNWNDVLGERTISLQSSNVSGDWMQQ